MFSIIQGVMGLIGRHSMDTALGPVLEGIMISDPLIRGIIRTRPMDMEVNADLDGPDTSVRTIRYDEHVPLAAPTLLALRAVGRVRAKGPERKRGTSRGHVLMPQRTGPASVYAASLPQRREKAQAQIEAAAAHLAEAGFKKEARALLAQGRETWAKAD